MTYKRRVDHTPPLPGSHHNFVVAAAAAAAAAAVSLTRRSMGLKSAILDHTPSAEV